MDQTPVRVRETLAKVAPYLMTFLIGAAATAGFNYLAEERAAARQESAQLTAEERDRRQALRLVSDELWLNSLNLDGLDCACLPAEATTREAQLEALAEYFPETAWHGEKRLLARYLSPELWARVVTFYAGLDAVKDHIMVASEPGVRFPPEIQSRIQEMVPFAQSLFTEINHSVGDDILNE